MNREQWLSAGIEALREHFEQGGYMFPKLVRVSVGWPRSSRKAIGQCWKRSASKDGTSQVFISPAVASGVDALDVIAHELVHAALDCEHGHTGEFIKACKKLGVTKGKPTCAGAGPELRAKLEQIAQQIGEYPHAQLSPIDLKKQTTRLLKVECKECGYTARVTSKWLDNAGAPLCPCNEEQMQVDRRGRKKAKAA